MGVLPLSRVSRWRRWRDATRLLLALAAGVGTAVVTHSAPAPAAVEADRPAVPTPRLAGPWIRLAGRPVLERWHAEKVEPVDFTVFRADDGRW
jgi:hypothetical protein